MKKKTMVCMLLALLSSLLLGCSPKATMLSDDGKESIHFIECDGLLRSFDSCVEKAKEICKGGFSIINANYNGSTGVIFGRDKMPGYLLGENNRSLLVKCTERKN